MAETLLAALELAQGSVFGPVVVVLTDGTDTCGGHDMADEVHRRLASNAALGIRTEVIGLPGSESAREDLSSIARAGGSWRCRDSGADEECHFDLSASADLKGDLFAALAEILGRVPSCEMLLPEVAIEPAVADIDPDRIGVTLNGAFLPRISASRCESSVEGWHYSEDPHQIVLCGESCRAVQEQLDTSIVLQLACVPPVDMR